ncbi:hypothetical protein [Pseudomonas citronellolis]|uniref:hypothetical protein n=1 Tax=Pseudomonas citronellolis TaxID=53408 RepID=UPI00248EA380|nr:hypothetical protein [Pseudomonas citronellolis]
MAAPVPVYEVTCENCGGEHHTAYVDAAAHDPRLLDLVVECDSCGRTLNEFVEVRCMTLVNEGTSEVRDA